MAVEAQHLQFALRGEAEKRLAVLRVRVRKVQEQRVVVQAVVAEAVVHAVTRQGHGHVDGRVLEIPVHGASLGYFVAFGVSGDGDELPVAEERADVAVVVRAAAKCQHHQRNEREEESPCGLIFHCVFS